MHFKLDEEKYFFIKQPKIQQTNHYNSQEKLVFIK